MGTKGRDLAVWCFIFTSLLGVIFSSIVFLIIDIFWATFIFYHYISERKKVIKYGQVLLVPINPIWAKTLVKGRIKGNWEKAYEVHINFNDKPLKPQWRSINHVLNHIRHNPGLYIWETYLPFPKNIREFITPSTAFIKKGCFIPRPPLVYQYRGKELKHGAVLIPRKEALLCVRKP